jgi:hypothetical protein
MSNELIVTTQEIDFLTITTAPLTESSCVIPYVGDLMDVDSTGIAHGAVLVYDAPNKLWKMTTLLHLQTIDGGDY